MKDSKAEQRWRAFINLCEEVGKDHKLAPLFDLMLTPEERADIGKRLDIIKALLAEKHSQRDIAERLGVSIAKITRGSNELKRMSDSFVDYLRKKLVD